MNSAQIGLVILCVIAFCMVMVCEITIYLIRKFFKFLDNRKKYKNKIAELESQLKEKIDNEHKSSFTCSHVKSDNLPFE